MLFNSFDFGFFLVIAYSLYWLLGSRQRIAQNVLLLLASYLFYGLWDWRFLGLLFASSCIDYFAGRAIGNSSKKSHRKFWLYTSVLWNLGVLVTFKYFNFFIDGFHALFTSESVATSYSIWNVVIPLGLSFYTFQTMSYTIDVYRNRIKPTKNILEFLCFVSFFPQLVAGPIERAKFLLPQFQIERKFNLQQSKEGLRQILWGLFKKVLVADKLGIAVTMAFNNPEQYGSLTLAFAAALFSFQVYCDFSGYTDIAVGTAKLFGFKLHNNFNIPYLAKSITEFWQRWHITLTKWFTDYVYIPFVKSFKRITVRVRVIGLLLTMFLVGLWHGANWTFTVFGLYNGVILVVERIPFFGRKNTLVKWLPNRTRLFSLFYFFTLTSISSVFFRAESLDHAWYILKRILSFTDATTLSSLIGIKLGYLAILIVAEVITKTKAYPLAQLEAYLPRAARWTIYYILIILIVRYAEPKEAFIYFQF
ncbi:MBOAT family protein [Rasiella rasia]|uniref:MBOAT family protein n=1 Tax=Rasiella rasia TaxID=2744027 RepID=A0A6G6GIA2_9FLAO|nr:MBOAT family protein [Rasiella rasia]QIE58316.1 MBOAT family protein [Rasiella rasia]